MIAPSRIIICRKENLSTQSCVAELLSATLSQIKAKIQRETGIPAQEQQITVNGRLVPNDEALAGDVFDGGALQLTHMPSERD